MSQNYNSLGQRQSNLNTTSYPIISDQNSRTKLTMPGSELSIPNSINGYTFTSPDVIADARANDWNLILVETKRLIRNPYMSSSCKPKPEGYLDFIYKAMREASEQPVVTGTMYIRSRVPDDEVLGDFRLRFDLEPEKLRKVLVDVDTDEVERDIESARSGKRIILGIQELEYLLLIRELVIKGNLDPMELFGFREHLSADERYGTASEKYLIEHDMRDGENKFRLLPLLTGHVTERYAREILRESNGFCEAYDYNNIAKDEHGHEGESDMLVAIKSEEDVRRLIANLESYKGTCFGATNDLKRFMSGEMNIVDFQAMKDRKRTERILTAA